MATRPLLVSSAVLALLAAACAPRPAAEEAETAPPETVASETGTETVTEPETIETETTEAAPPAVDPVAEENDQVFAEFIPWPEADDRVVTTESGLKYVILASGPDAGVSPKPENFVTVNYEGRIASSGEKFDSSFDRGQPATFPAGRLIKGWVEALQLMKPGDDWVLYIPTDLGYGQNPRPGVIKPGDDLVFRVSMLEVIAPSYTAWEAMTPWDSASEGVQTTESGLEYIVLEQGDPEADSPSVYDKVLVHYEGRLSDGTVFDSSFARGEPVDFAPNEVIPGWTEMLQLMKPGERVLVKIPSALAYGPAGTPGGPIPPDADLVFEIQMLDVLVTR